MGNKTVLPPLPEFITKRRLYYISEAVGVGNQIITRHEFPTFYSKTIIAFQEFKARSQVSADLVILLERQSL